MTKEEALKRIREMRDITQGAGFMLFCEAQPVKLGGKYDGSGLSLADSDNLIKPTLKILDQMEEYWRNQ